MRRALVLAAMALVLVSSVWVLVSSARNRSDAAGGSVELTERELRLPPALGESTVLFLTLRWDVPSSDPDDDRAPDWLTPAKLTELGLDCSMPATSPDAKAHYAAALAVPAYVVLEHEGETWKRARRSPHRTSRLFAVDAGREAAPLRETYRDPGRYVIAQAIVRVGLQDRDSRDGALLAEPRLHGWIEAVLPDQIFVPPPHCDLLQGLRGGWEAPEDEARREPRFAARISWGRSHEPWVESVRLLSPGDAAAAGASGTAPGGGSAAGGAPGSPAPPR
jgi:hypothetical protein